MAVPIGDSVRVGVVFGGTPRVRPVWFIWNGREVRVRAVTWTWESRDGGVRYRHFAVTDGAGVYELRYEAEGMRWTLEEAEPTGQPRGKSQPPNPKSQRNPNPQIPKQEEKNRG